MFDYSDSVFQFLLILKQKKVYIFNTIPYQRVIKLEIFPKYVLLTYLMYLEKKFIGFIILLF